MEYINQFSQATKPVLCEHDEGKPVIRIVQLPKDVTILTLKYCRTCRSQISVEAS